MNILIVDDSAFARRRIAQVLREAGHTVLQADSGRSALARFAETSPDLVTVDLLMPEMDGLELIGHLREIRPDVPIIAISADVQQATRDEVFSAGASAFVSKAGHLPEILEAVQAVSGLVPLPAMSPMQQDTFTETMNIAMGQAAQALGTLLERRVLLKVPEVEIMRASELRAFCDREVSDVGAAVLQTFSGQLSGLGSLVFPQRHAVTLMRILIPSARELDQLSSAEQTVLAEVGNVVINAALASLGDLLRTRLIVSLPTVYLNLSGAATARLVLRESPGAGQAIVLLSRLTIGTVDLMAYLLLMLPQVGVQRLLHSLGV
jgi:two-component system chemotaxis response regulator CheY